MIGLKNFLSTVIFTILIALIISPNIAQAEKSEIEELYDTLQVGKAAFTATDDYSFLVNGKHYAVAARRVTDYKRVSEETKKLFESASVGYVKRCAWEIDLIIKARLATLNCFITALNCYSVGDNDGFDYYVAQMEYYGVMALKLRQAFLERYGI